VTSCWYSAEIDTPLNHKFASAFHSEFKYDPGFYAAATYVEAAVLEAALNAAKGNIEDKSGFMKILRATKTNTVRGPVAFDEYGNVVGNVYIRKVERRQGRLANAVIHTYPNVSQFWTYDPKEFLKNPVYSRDWPPAKNIES
jgi:branched-chain amino acid transport system substrate-binding protein